jgi:hypothetical protein
MRRIIGLVFVALGVALIVLAIALPNYVYNRVAKPPDSPETTMVGQGSGITVFLPRSLDEGGTRILTGRTVTQTQRVVGEIRPDAKKPGKNDRFYRQAIAINVEGAGLLQAYVEGASFDAKTGLANNCCGDYLSTDPTDTVGVPIKHDGLVFKFPFDTQKTNYRWWDSQIKKATTARYDGQEKIDGLQTYRFVQSITDVVIAQDDIPGTLIGLPDEPSVHADRVYSNVRTLWVEPYTGAVIKGSERPNVRFVSNGKQAPVLQGNLAFTDKTVKANVDKYSESASGLKFVTKTGPIGSWVLGPILLVIGLVLILRSGRRDNDWEDPDEI